MENKITFIGNMLEVNRVEVNLKQFVDVLELGLTHKSLNTIYNELIGGYILSGYQCTLNSYPLFDQFINNELVPEFKNEFASYKSTTNRKIFERMNDKYYLIYVQELERCVSSIDLNDAYDPSKLSLSHEMIKFEDGSEYKVVNPTYLDQVYETEISYTLNEFYYALKSDGRLVNLKLNN